MAEYEPLEIRGYFRSHSHLPIWEVMDKAGMWEQVGLKVNFEFCNSSSAAEKALFDGTIDFVSGNHISPYLLVRRGKPIVCLASPSNSVNDKLVARLPIALWRHSIDVAEEREALDHGKIPPELRPLPEDRADPGDMPHAFAPGHEPVDDALTARLSEPARGSAVAVRALGGGRLRRNSR